MKKLIYSVAILLVTATFAQAQQREDIKRDKGAQADRLADRMQKKLALTADQRQKFRAIEMERAQKMQEWRKRDVDNRKSAMKERGAFMKAQREKMDRILNPEQREKLKSMHADQVKRMKSHRNSLEKRHRPMGKRDKGGDRKARMDRKGQWDKKGKENEKRDGKGRQR